MWLCDSALCPPLSVDGQPARRPGGLAQRGPPACSGTRRARGAGSPGWCDGQRVVGQGLQRAADAAALGQVRRARARRRRGRRPPTSRCAAPRRAGRATGGRSGASPCRRRRRGTSGRRGASCAGSRPSPARPATSRRPRRSRAPAGSGPRARGRRPATSRSSPRRSRRRRAGTPGSRRGRRRPAPPPRRGPAARAAPGPRSARWRGSTRSSCSAADWSQPQSSRATNGSSTRVRTSCRIRRRRPGTRASSCSPSTWSIQASRAATSPAPRSSTGSVTTGTTVPSAAAATSCAGQHQELCSHRSVTPSATSSTHAGSSVTSAATTARVSRSSRPNTCASYSTRSPSRRYRAYWLASGWGHGVPRSACARARRPRSSTDAQKVRSVGRGSPPRTAVVMSPRLRIGDDRK